MVNWYRNFCLAAGTWRAQSIRVFASHSCFIFYRYCST